MILSVLLVTMLDYGKLLLSSNRHYHPKARLQAIMRMSQLDLNGNLIHNTTLIVGTVYDAEHLEITAGC